MTVTRISVEPQQRMRDCGLTLHETLVAIPGMTYRQLDFWVRTGRITCHHHLGRNPAIYQRGGSGSDRCWPQDQVNIAARMFKLITRGIRDVDTAHALATDRGVLMELMSELTKIEAEQEAS